MQTVATLPSSSAVAVNASGARSVASPARPFDSYEHVQAAAQGEQADAVACMQLTQGVVSGAFMVNIPKIAQVAAQTAGVFVEELAQHLSTLGSDACRTAGGTVANGVYSMTQGAQQLASQAANMTVVPVYRFWTWPLRKTVAILTPSPPPPDASGVGRPG